MISLGQLVTKVFERLNNSAVRYIVMRNYEGYPSEVGNDIDILLHLDDANSASNLTKEVFRECGLEILQMPIESNGFLLKASQSDGVSLAIHFQFWISFEFNPLHKYIKGYSYKLMFEGLDVKKYSNDDCQFYIASDSDRFIMLLKQWLFKRKESYKSELIELLQVVEIKSLLEKAELQHYSGELLFESDNTTTFVMKTLILSHWDNQSQFVNYYKALSVSLKNKKNSTFAPIIYITGPDGAGKTSASALIKDILKSKELSYKHVYSVKRNIIRHAIFIVRRKLSGKNDNKFSDDPGSRKFRFIMTEDIMDRDDNSMLWRLRKLTTLCISIFDVFINFLAVLYFRYKHDVVIVETSPYDIFIKYHMPEFKMLEKVFAPLFPKPTIGFLLKADAEKIAARKHELTPEEIVDYYKRLDILLEKAGVSNQFHTVQTDIDMSVTQEQLASLLDRVMIK